MATKWYFRHDGQERGPVSAAQLRELAAAGKLLPSDQVTKEGKAKWVPARAIKGLWPEEPEVVEVVPSLASGDEVRQPSAAGGKVADFLAKAASFFQKATSAGTQTEVRQPKFPVLVLGGALLFVFGFVCGALTIRLSAGGGVAGKSGQKGEEQASDAKPVRRLTKAQFRSKVMTFEGQGTTKWPGINGANVTLRTKDFYDAFGKPDRTQTVGRDTYWYYQCQDGLVQVLIGFSPGETLFLMGVNDY